MTKKIKLLKRLGNNTKDAKFSEVQKLLKDALRALQRLEGNYEKR